MISMMVLQTTRIHVREKRYHCYWENCECEFNAYRKAFSHIPNLRTVHIISVVSVGLLLATIYALFKMKNFNWVLVAHACNPNY
jgi:hypothetical protein